MFEALNSLPADKTLAVVHQAIRIIRHLSHVPALDRYPVAHALAQVLDDEDPGTAVKLVDEIERREGATLQELSDETLNRYVVQLADTAERRAAEEYRVDASRGRELLARMRSASGF